VLAFVLLVVIGAQAAPTAAEARNLEGAKSWDELYLRFASAKPETYSASDRGTIANALLAAAHHLESEDKGLAFSAADLASHFQPKVPTLLYVADLARGANSNGQAAEALDRALALDKKNSKALLARADLAMAESDHALALSLYLRVPKSASDGAKARAGIDAARQAIAQQHEAQGEVKKIESDLAHPKPLAPGSAVAMDPRGSPAEAGMIPGESRSLGLDGMRIRESPYFHFIYSGSGKDFAVRSDYEGKVADALEEARAFVIKEWGQARETPVDVVLYTKEEYELHFGGSSLGRALGFYSGKIRVTNAGDITQEVKTTIVHEYVHAVVDDLVKSRPVPPWLQEGTATVVEMQYRGNSDGSSPQMIQNRLRSLAINHRLPSLESLNRSFVELGDTQTAYHYSAAAVRELISRGGISGYLEFLGEIGQGRPFLTAFSAHYFPKLSDLDEILQANLARME
jgi:hypothetical protein